ncbi:hypothetical protein [Bacillus sp. es.036]|uniref:hypothetical protein n=1 Tax=Bacillus sp. es.036 TaxID=1761764 RepID=UPI000BF3DAB6|nr:hypothetical protein [Bacillus sp. es.036]PFG15079.1 putative ribosomally synthesized peptide with SipW-like signal peptide [Bacillus sp. es.036]
MGLLKEKSERRKIKSQRLVNKPQISYKIPKALSINFALSALILSGLAQITGQTYSSYSDTESISGQIKTCEVFPSAIQDSYNELDQHLQIVIQLSNAIYTFEQEPFEFEESNSVDQDATPEQLITLSGDSEVQIKALTKELQAIDKQHLTYSEIKISLQNELDGMKKVITTLKQYDSGDSKCTKIDKSEIRTKLIDDYRKSNFLPSTYQNEIATLLDLSPKNQSSTNENTKQEITKDLADVLNILGQESKVLKAKIEELENLAILLQKKAEKEKIANESTVKEDNEIDQKNESETTDTETNPPKANSNSKDVTKEAKPQQEENKDNPQKDTDSTEDPSTEPTIPEEEKGSSTDGQDIETPPNDVSEEVVKESPASSTENENQE